MNALTYFRTNRNLPGHEKSLHQLAFTTDDHRWESLEAFPGRHFGTSFEPIGQQDEVFDRKLAGFHAINQMAEQCWWQVLATNFWHIACPP